MERWGAKSKFTEICKKKCLFDELHEDERLSDGKNPFRMNVLNASQDIFIRQLLQRFTFNCSRLPNLAQCLTKHHSRDFTEQPLAVRVCFESDMTKDPTTKDLARMLIVEHSGSNI